LTQTLPLEDIPRLQVLLAGALASPEMLAATGVYPHLRTTICASERMVNNFAFTRMVAVASKRTSDVT
jgi:hypothetical protein